MSTVLKDKSIMKLSLELGRALPPIKDKKGTKIANSLSPKKRHNFQKFENSDFGYPEESKSQRGTSQTIEDYQDQMKQLMSRYRTELGDTEKISENNDIDISLEDEIDIKNGLKNNHNSVSNAYYGTSENSILKVGIKLMDYKNPFESFKVLKKNKIIFDNISYSSYNRQKLFYDEALEDIKRYMKLKVKMPKIKVTNVMPKHAKQQDTALNFALPEIKSAKKKNKKNQKEVEEPQVVQNQVVINQDNLKLYCYYTYANKNFPEGREQFAFHNHLTDIFLYGGIVSNKNNNVWRLDPG